VLELNGQPTQFQMERFTVEFRRLGGRPDDPAIYGAEYARRLIAVLHERWSALQTGRARPIEWVVPHAHDFLEAMRRRGVSLYVASGSEFTHVCHEAELLDVVKFFVGRIHAPRGEKDGFTKQGVVNHVLAAEQISGSELIGFGDGVVETR